MLSFIFFCAFTGFLFTVSCTILCVACCKPKSNREVITQEDLVFWFSGICFGVVAGMICILSDFRTRSLLY